MQPTPEPVLPSDREYLTERRRALLMELTAIERRLGMPSSLVKKQERRQESYEQRVRETFRREG